MQPESPWRTADFRALFAATALSQLGTNIGYVALPLSAVAALDAGPGQVGALATLGTLAFLLIGLPAGAWVDRMRHRRVLIAADLARTVLFASIPLAWWLDALTLGQLYAVAHLASAVQLVFVRGKEAPSGPARDTGLAAQIAEGLRHVLGDRELCALALTGALTNHGSQLVNTMLPILFVQELGLSAGALGLYWAAGGVGLLLGARCARPLAARLGHGRTLGLGGLVLAPAGLLVPLIGPGPWLWIAGAGWTLAMFKTGVDNVLGVSLRQRMTPDNLLGRMNATFRFLLTGALAIGAAVSGLLGELAGVRATLWVGGAFLAVAFLPVFLSPVRTRRELPRQHTEPEPRAGEPEPKLREPEPK
ncbi:MFS transporter [Streptomyces sp. V4I2]|uniref:MFS transporter n=1 Tax=Streptomyces sp. V4I2 TaxID=3042280 RepID=UPI002788E3A6|nr:MFS transporter [Streptomyces sp. V4I2]MDQ1050627.1 MFS family permease [Streptomyces sp. V4I2]